MGGLGDTALDRRPIEPVERVDCDHRTALPDHLGRKRGRAATAVQDAAFGPLILQAEERCVFSGITPPGHRVGDRELGAVVDRGEDRRVQRAGSNCFDEGDDAMIRIKLSSVVAAKSSVTAATSLEGALID